MDIATIVGLVLAISMIIFGMDFQFNTFWDQTSVFIVVGGTLGATVLTNPLADTINAIKVGLKAFKDDQQDPAELIATMVGFAETARREGILALESEAADAGDEFLSSGIQLAVDGTEPDLIMEILETEIMWLEERHKSGAEWFSRVATMAPAYGMIGTLIGLVLMLKSMDDPAAIGPAMAICLLTTLYGSLIANLYFDPVAAKLKIKSAKELLGRRMIVEGIMSIQSGDNPRLVQQKLSAFLSPSIRPSSDDGGGE